MIPVIFFVGAMLLEILGYEISGGAWSLIVLMLVSDEFDRRFGKNKREQ